MLSRLISIVCQVDRCRAQPGQNNWAHSLLTPLDRVIAICGMKAAVYNEGQNIAAVVQLEHFHLWADWFYVFTCTSTGSFADRCPLDGLNLSVLSILGTGLGHTVCRLWGLKSKTSGWRKLMHIVMCIMCFTSTCGKLGLLHSGIQPKLKSSSCKAERKLSR